MLNLNPNTLAAVVSKALADAAANQRWANAIRRAADELDSNPWIARNPNGHGLIIGSPSGACYSANSGECSCPAFAFGRACYHRALAQLVRRHDERQASAAQLADTVIAIVEQTQAARKIAAQRATAALNELYA